MNAANNVSIGLAFVAGLLSFISPCVLPLMPAYVSYLTGRVTLQNATEAGQGASAPPLTRRQRFGTLAHGLFFVAGFTLVFVVFGLLTNAGAQALRVRSYDVQRLIAQLGGLLIIFFALHILGITGWLLNKLITQARTYEKPTILRLLERLQSILYGDSRWQVNPRLGYGYAGSTLLGITFAAGWTPCVGPIYGSIIGLAINASKTNDFTLPAILLFAYSMGLGIPFLIASAALDRVRGLFKRIQRQIRLVEMVSGVLLLVVGSLLLFDRFSYVNEFAIGLSDFSYKLESCTTGLLQGQIPAGDYGRCMNVGPDSTGAQPTSQISPLLGMVADRLLIIGG